MATMDEEIIAICIDSGSGRIKAGFAGEETPRSIFPNVVARSGEVGTVQAGGGSSDQGTISVGARALQGTLPLSHPVQKGLVTNWDDMEKVWQHTLSQELRVTPDEHPVLVTEPPLNPKANREALTRVWFESFNVPCLYVSMAAVCALYSSGKTTAVVLDSGDGITHAVPVIEGYAVPAATQKMNFSGAELTEFLRGMLQARDCAEISGPDGSEIVRQIKESLCYVASDYAAAESEAAETHAGEKSYELPDGRKIVLGSERFRCAEALFQPEIAQHELQGIHKYAVDSVMRCEVEARRELLLNVVLAGGSTLFEGIGERLWSEMFVLVPSSHKVKIFAPPERAHSPWLGTSILASLSTFQTMWITKAEYDESGPNIIHRKCF